MVPRPHGAPPTSARLASPVRPTRAWQRAPPSSAEPGARRPLARVADAPASAGRTRASIVTRPETEEDASRRCISCAVQQLARLVATARPSRLPSRTERAAARAPCSATVLGSSGADVDNLQHVTKRPVALHRVDATSPVAVASSQSWTQTPINREAPGKPASQKASRIGNLRWRCVDIKVAGVALFGRRADRSSGIQPDAGARRVVIPCKGVVALVGLAPSDDLDPSLVGKTLGYGARI